jgi:hypothetical protein
VTHVAGFNPQACRNFLQIEGNAAQPDTGMEQRSAALAIFFCDRLHAICSKALCYVQLNCQQLRTGTNAATIYATGSATSCQENTGSSLIKSRNGSDQ